MNYILDTHVLLWSIFEPEKLSKTAQQILLDKTCVKAISLSTMWEIGIKYRIKKLPLPKGVPSVFEVVKSRGYGYINIDKDCIEAYSTLPLKHGDPFDGIIIATAIVEKMTIITDDSKIQEYDVPWIW